MFSRVFGNSRPLAPGCFYPRPSHRRESLRVYLLNAQGVGVVAIRTPKEITLLAQDMPEVFAELEKVQRLRVDFRDMQDFEFDEDGRLSCSKPATVSAPGWLLCVLPLR